MPLRVDNPFSGELVCEFDFVEGDALETRVAAARAAFERWRGEPSVAGQDLKAAGAVRVAGMAEAGGVRSVVSVSLPAALGGDERLQANAGSVPGAEVCQARVATHHHRLHASE